MILWVLYLRYNFVNQKDSASRFIDFSNNFAKYFNYWIQIIFLPKKIKRIEKIKYKIEQNKKKFYFNTR